MIRGALLIVCVCACNASPGYPRQGVTYRDGADGGPFLPHPRMADRAFVLLPLAEIAPGWRHPATGQTVEALIAALPPGQAIRPMAEET